MGSGWKQNPASLTDAVIALWSSQKAAEPVGACGAGGQGWVRLSIASPHGSSLVIGVES